MKKSLIALAVAGVVSAPAFAATSNVDVYGKLNVSMSVFNDQDPAAEDLQLSSTGSRIGFKGAEDLGGGLSAIWQIESGVNLDEQNGTLASRNSFVGLKGGFGTVLAGNHDTPLKLVGRAVDLFGDTMADSRNVMGGGSDTRAQNVVAYISPDFTGMTFAAAYSTEFSGVNGTEGDSIDSSVYNLNATYTNGPLFLGAAFGDGDGHEAADLGAHWRLAAGYTFGNFKVVGQYDSLEDETAAVGNGDYEAWMVGAAYTMGSAVLKANYMTGEFDTSGVEREQWTIGADYNLSKRTSVYALYADGSNVTLGGGAGSSDRVAGEVVAGDDDVSVISLGISHAF
jgi:predicted porin